MDLRQAITSAKDYRIKPVEMPEWGCTVYIRTLSAAATISLFTAAAADVNGGDAKHMPAFVCAFLCDEQGKRIFNDDETHLVGERSPASLKRLFDEWLVLTGATPDATEQTEKN